jgi:hypothetical protein
MLDKYVGKNIYKSGSVSCPMVGFDISSFEFARCIIGALVG